MKIFLTFITLLSVSPIFAQHILSVPIYQYTAISEPLNVKKDHRTVNGLFLEKVKTSRLSFVGGITFSEDDIDDNCDGCADHFHGVGAFREIAIFSGIKIYLRESTIDNFKPFTSTESYLAKSTYQGEFGGGFIGQGYIFDDDFLKFGFIQRAGMDIYLTDRIVISPITGIRLGVVQQNSNINDYSATRFDLFQWLPFEMRIGLVF